MRILRPSFAILIAIALLDAGCSSDNGVPDDTDTSNPPPPILQTAALPDGEVSQAYPDQQLAVTDGAAPFSFQLTAGALPDGMTLSGNGLISGTPITVTGSPFIFTIEVTDNDSRTDSEQYAITVNTAAPTLDPAVLPAGESGQVYPDQQLTVTDGSTPFSFQLVAGDLPDGLTLSSNGLISGTPTTETGSPFDFTVEMTDSQSRTDTQDYSITVNPAAPMLDAATLPAGATGTPYPDQQLSVSNGRAPFGFQLNAGALPDGLTLSSDGLISGTPTNAAGSPFDFAVQVTDADSRTDTEDYSIEVTTGLPPATLTTGLHTMTSQAVERSFYIRVPTDYSPAGDPKPILFGFHGTDGSHERWLPGGLYGGGVYNEIADQAILVFPDASPVGQAPVRQFSRDTDGLFFIDLLEYIRQDLGFDENRVFVTGQSSGAGFAHEIGCDHGDIIRGIAPAAGALIPQDCTGATAVMIIAGENDELVPLTIIEPTHQLWTAYNGFDIDVSQQSPIDQCVDHSLGGSDYPVYWCLHPGEGFRNHSFPSFAAAAIWSFFSNLMEVAPSSDPPPGGGNDRVTSELPTTLTVTLDFPTSIGNVYRMAIALYEEGWRPGDFSAPIAFLNLDPEFDPVVPGTQQALNIPINLPAGFNYPAIYVVAFSIYVDGGSYPIPLSGVDHFAWYETVINDATTPIFIPDPLIVDPYP